MRSWLRPPPPATRLLLGAVMLAAVAAGAGAAGCDPGTDRALQRMMWQAKAKPYAATRYLPRDMAMQAPPPGTVARDAVIGQPAFTDGEVAGRPVDTSPVPVTRALLTRGRQRFETICATCHGLAGDGDSIVASNMKLRRAPSLEDGLRRALPIGRIFQVATEGYGLMPAWAPVISTEDRWAIVNYVKALQLSQNVPLAQLPPAVRAEAQRSLP